MTERHRGNIFDDLVSAFNRAVFGTNDLAVFEKGGEAVEAERYERYKQAYKEIAGDFSYGKDEPHLRAFYDYFMDKLNKGVEKGKVGREAVDEPTEFDKTTKRGSEPGRRLGRAVTSLLRKAGIKVVTDGEKVRRALDVAEVSVMEFAKINQSSAELDRQLDAYSNGERNKSLSFGRPGAILRYAGMKRGNIEMEIGTFTEHLKKHNLSVEDIKGIVKAINDPILVYDWGQTGASHIIVTDMAIPNRGQLTIAVRIVNKGKNPNISEIASIHIKEADRMTTEILSNEDFASKNLRYVNKKRAQDWLSGASPKEATHQGSNTSSLTNRRELDAKLQKIFDAQAKKQKKDNLVQAMTAPNERDAEYAKAVADGNMRKACQSLL